MIFVISEWFNKCVYLMINWEECCNKIVIRESLLL